MDCDDHADVAARGSVRSCILLSSSLSASNLPFMKTLLQVAESYYAADCHREVSVLRSALDLFLHDREDTAAKDEMCLASSHYYLYSSPAPMDVIKIISNWKIGRDFKLYHAGDDAFPASLAQYLRWVKFEQQPQQYFASLSSSPSSLSERRRIDVPPERYIAATNSPHSQEIGEGSDAETNIEESTEEKEEEDSSGDECSRDRREKERHRIRKPPYASSSQWPPHDRVFSVHEDITSRAFGGGARAEQERGNGRTGNVAFSAATLANIVLAHVEASGCDKSTTTGGGSSGSFTRREYRYGDAGEFLSGAQPGGQGPTSSAPSSSAGFRFSYSSTRSDPARAYNTTASNDNTADGTSFLQAFPSPVSEQHAVAVLGISLFETVGKAFDRSQTPASATTLRIPVLRGQQDRDRSGRDLDVFGNRSAVFDQMRMRRSGSASVVELWDSASERTRSLDVSQQQSSPLMALAEAKRFRSQVRSHNDLMLLLKELWLIMDNCVLPPMLTSRRGVHASAATNSDDELPANAISPVCSDPWLIFGPNSARTATSDVRVMETEGGSVPTVFTRFDVKELKSKIFEWLGRSEEVGGTHRSSFGDAAIEGTRAAVDCVLGLCTVPPKNKANMEVLNMDFLHHCFYDALKSAPKSIIEEYEPIFSSNRGTCSSAGLSSSSSTSSASNPYPSTSGRGLFPFVHLIQRQLTTMSYSSENTCESGGRRSVGSVSDTTPRNAGRGLAFVIDTQEVLEELRDWTREEKSERDVPESFGEKDSASVPLFAGPPLLHLASLGKAVGETPQHYIPRILTEMYTSNYRRRQHHHDNLDRPIAKDSIHVGTQEGSEKEEEEDVSFPSKDSEPEMSDWIKIASILPLTNWGLPASEPCLDALTAHHSNASTRRLHELLRDKVKEDENGIRELGDDEDSIGFEKQSRDRFESAGRLDGNCPSSAIVVPFVDLVIVAGPVAYEHIQYVHDYNEKIRSLMERILKKEVGNDEGDEEEESMAGDGKVEGTEDGVQCEKGSAKTRHEGRCVAGKKDNDNDNDNDHNDRLGNSEDDAEALEILGSDYYDPNELRRLEVMRETLRRRVGVLSLLREQQQRAPTSGCESLKTSAKFDKLTSRSSRRERRGKRNIASYLAPYGGVVLLAGVGNSLLARLTTDAFGDSVLPNPSGQLMNLRIPRAKASLLHPHDTDQSTTAELRQYPRIIDKERVVQNTQHCGVHKFNSDDQNDRREQHLLPAEEEEECIPSADPSGYGVYSPFANVNDDFVAVMALSNLTSFSGGSEKRGRRSGALGLSGVSIGMDDIDAAAISGGSSRVAESVTRRAAFVVTLMPFVLSKHFRRIQNDGTNSNCDPYPQRAFSTSSSPFNALRRTVLVGSVLGPTLSVFEKSFWSTVASLSRLFALFYEHEREATGWRWQQQEACGSRTKAREDPTRWRRLLYLQFTGGGPSGASEIGHGQATAVAIEVLKAIGVAAGDRLIKLGGDTCENGKSLALAERCVAIYMAASALEEALKRFAELSLSGSNVPYYESCIGGVLRREHQQSANFVDVEGNTPRLIDPLSGMGAAEIAQKRLNRTIETARECCISSKKTSLRQEIATSGPISVPHSTLMKAMSIASRGDLQSSIADVAPPLLHGLANASEVARYNALILLLQEVESTRRRAHTDRTALTVYDELTELPPAVYVTDGRVSDWSVIITNSETISVPHQSEDNDEKDKDTSLSTRRAAESSIIAKRIEQLQRSAARRHLADVAVATLDLLTVPIGAKTSAYACHGTGGAANRFASPTAHFSYALEPSQVFGASAVVKEAILLATGLGGSISVSKEES